MLLYIFVPHYPSLFKPYYDAQFASLLDLGHDVRVFSMGNLDSGVNDKVLEYRLERRTRRYYGSGLRELPSHTPEILRALVGHPAPFPRLFPAGPTRD